MRSSYSIYFDLLHTEEAGGPIPSRTPMSLCRSGLPLISVFPSMQPPAHLSAPEVIRTQARWRSFFVPFWFRRYLDAKAAGHTAPESRGL